MDLPRKLIELRRLRGRLRLEPEALRELRERKLRSLVRHAYRNVEFYRRLLDGAGVDPTSIRTLGDLARIPVTTKQDLRDGGPAVLTRGADPAACVRYLTSGTSGKALVVLLSADEARTRLLVELRGLLATGLLELRERLAILGPVAWGPGHLYQRAGLFRREYISPQLPVNEQIARLGRLKPDVLWIYPSLLTAIVERLGGRLSRVARPRALITSAEGIPPELEARIRADMEVEWFNFYASAETGRIGWECTAHAGLHLNVDTLIVELVPDATGVARSVVTALDTRTMPILRYELGDVTAEIEGACSCGTTFPRIRAPQGRIIGLVRLPDGRSLSSWSVRSFIRDHPGVDQYRLHQKRTDHVVLHLALRGPSDVPALENRLRDRLGPSVVLEVVTGSTIPPGPATTFVSDL